MTLALVALAACSEHQTKTAERSVSPLIGTWTRSGNTSDSGSNRPEFTKLTFQSDGSLKAQYADSGGALSTIAGSKPKIKNEGDTYTTSDDSTLHIAEGSRTLDYTYHVADGKLSLTASGSSDSSEFTKAS